MRYTQLYSELGKLLYAIADVDKRITKQEKQKLLEIINKELVPNEEHTDEFGSSVAFYPEIEFEFLEDEIIDTESSFQSFLDYIEKHHTAIDKKTREMCLKVAKEIANSFHGTNQKEKDLLDQLKQKLTELNKLDD